MTRDSPLIGHFDGPAYDPAVDRARLSSQHRRLFQLMRDGRWRSLDEIARATGDPDASISAQLRHLRKPRFGGHRVEKRRVARSWDYRVVVAGR
jgi:predicted transcriptional regulator